MAHLEGKQKMTVSYKLPVLDRLYVPWSQLTRGTTQARHSQKCLVSIASQLTVPTPGFINYQSLGFFSTEIFDFEILTF